MQKKSIEIAVGGFVLAGIIALVMLAVHVGNLSTIDIKEGYTVTARFSNVGGLHNNAPVSMAGVQIGRVTDIKIDNEFYDAIVTMTIDKRYNLPSDTSASILTSGLLGAQFLGLSPGGEDAYLADGDEIEITQSALILEELISQFLFSKASE